MYSSTGASECPMGQNYFDGCNYCMCMSSGEYACTRRACNDINPSPADYVDTS